MTVEEFLEKFGREPKSDREQLAMLKRCSDKRDVSEWNTWIEKRSEVEIWLECADLRRAYLKGAVLRNAYLKGANLWGADLKGADLWGADLKGADLLLANLKGAVLRNAHLEGVGLTEAILKHACLDGVHLQGADARRTCLEGANLSDADLENADFTAAIVDNNTLIKDCTIDDKTNFSMVGLDSTRIDPSLLAALKTNIRRIAWNEWYESQKRNKIKKVPSEAKKQTGKKSIPDIAFPDCRIAKSIKAIYQYGVTASFMKLFWWISDYGSSTVKILMTFLLTVLLFTSGYACFEIYYPDVLSGFISPIQPDNWLSCWAWLGSWLAWFLQIIFFASATMVTLGFANINVAMSADSFCPSLWGMGLVAINLLTGYFLLAVLVTRIGILFQSMGPEQELTRSKNCLADYFDVSLDYLVERSDGPARR